MMHIEVLDEILNGEPRYRIRDKDGNILHDDITIELIKEILQKGTDLNKVLFDLLQESITNNINNQYVVGSYTGNINGNSESGSQFIELGFTPRMVYVQQQEPREGNNYLCAGCFGLALPNYPMKNGRYTIVKIEENGFTVYQSVVSTGYYFQNTNFSGEVYTYIAFK